MVTIPTTRAFITPTTPAWPTQTTPTPTRPRAASTPTRATPSTPPGPGPVRTARGSMPWPRSSPCACQWRISTRAASGPMCECDTVRDTRVTRRDMSRVTRVTSSVILWMDSWAPGTIGPSSLVTGYCECSPDAGPMFKLSHCRWDRDPTRAPKSWKWYFYFHIPHLIHDSDSVCIDHINWRKPLSSWHPSLYLRNMNSKWWKLLLNYIPVCWLWFLW